MVVCQVCPKECRTLSNEPQNGPLCRGHDLFGQPLGRQPIQKLFADSFDGAVAGGLSPSLLDLP